MTHWQVAQATLIGGFFALSALAGYLAAGLIYFP